MVPSPMPPPPPIPGRVTLPQPAPAPTWRRPPWARLAEVGVFTLIVIFAVWSLFVTGPSTAFAFLMLGILISTVLQALRGDRNGAYLRYGLFSAATALVVLSIHGPGPAVALLVVWAAAAGVFEAGVWVRGRVTHR